jgi:quercetin dioxygenase-like cupin family protein
MAKTARRLAISGADPRKLVEMTDYQSGSIVSRTLIQDSCGTLTVFSFDKGHSLSAHTVPFDAFIQVLDGQAEIIIGEKTCLVNSGEIVLMPGGSPHEVKAIQRFKMLLTMLKTKD